MAAIISWAIGTVLFATSSRVFASHMAETIRDLVQTAMVDIMTTAVAIATVIVTAALVVAGALVEGVARVMVDILATVAEDHASPVHIHT